VAARSGYALLGEDAMPCFAMLFICLTSIICDKKKYKQ
jgi:hypothetical protein